MISVAIIKETTLLSISFFNKLFNLYKLIIVHIIANVYDKKYIILSLKFIIPKHTPAINAVTILPPVANWLITDLVVLVKTKYVSGKAGYVERNYAMINDSDYCVFYYDEDYLPPKRKRASADISFYQPKSGTDLAYKYAIQKNKVIINILLK